MRLRGHPRSGGHFLTPVFRAAVLAACVALGIVVAAATSRALTEKPSVEPPADVLPVPVADIRSITVETGSRQISLARAADGTWTDVTGASAETEGLMADIQGRLFPLQGYRALAADTSSPEFGLVEPELNFRVLDARGREHRILLGAPTFTDGGVYARRSTDTERLYLVPRRMMDDLRSLLAGRRVDATSDLPGKLAEKTPRYDPTSWWLRQALDAEGAS